MPRRIPLLAFLLALVPGCLCGDGVNRGDLNLIPLDEEWALGEQLAAQARTQLALVDDPRAQAALDALGQAVAEETELADRPWRFYLVDDSSMNAFALPGGHVFVHTGLVEAAADVDELTSVIGHEVAHVVARHGTERMTKVYGLNLVAGLVLGRDPGVVEQIVAQVLGSGAVARFSRSDEREADVLGIGYMAEAGYDPHAMPAMFATMLEARQHRPNAVERFFASHPLTEERIEAAAERAEAMGAPKARKADDAAFRALRSAAAR